MEWSSEQGLVNANDLRDLNELIEASEFLMVAQELRERLGDNVLSRFVAEVFDPDAIVPSRIHELLSVIPFRGYLTTNYDNLLERAYTRVRKRQLEGLLPNTKTSLESLLERNPFLLKLHGDLEIPSSIILAHRDYLRLASDAKYQSLLDCLFSTFTVMMVGYGLTDLDIIQSLDRLAHVGSSRRHYLLCRRGTRNSIERRRLSRDRNIELIEYIDYFGFHNHVDTFLKAVMEGLGLGVELERVRPELRRRIKVHYPVRCALDGEFVWNYVFREGAITWSTDAQAKQIEMLQKSLEDGLRAIDYVVFLTDEEGFTDTEFRPLVEQAIETSRPVGVQVVFLVIGTTKRPEQLIPSATGSPVFYLKNKFGETDLEVFHQYVAQDMQAGFRQP